MNKRIQISVVLPIILIMYSYYDDRIYKYIFPDKKIDNDLDEKNIDNRLKNKENQEKEINCNDLIISREKWNASPPKGVSKIPAPLNVVIVAHTAIEPCFTRVDCIKQMNEIQHFHQNDNGWDDIGYNFLIGGDGSVFEGRGWQAIGAHSKNWNKGTLGIAFMGTFITEEPTKKQLTAAMFLLKCGVENNELSPNYRLLAHRQVRPTESPGLALFKQLQKWPNWSEEASLAPLTVST